MEFELPTDLSTLSDDQLVELSTEAKNYFDELAASEASAEVVTSMNELLKARKALKAESKRRTAAANKAATEQAALIEAANSDDDDDNTDDPDDPDDDPEQGPADTPDPAEEPPHTTPDVEKPEDKVLEDVTASAKIDPADLLPKTRKINVAAAKRRQPAMEMPDLGQSDEMVITASADIPGVRSGSTLASRKDIANAIHRRTRTLPITHNNPNYVPIATVQNRFENVVDLDTPPEDIEEMFKSISDVEDLVAAGGWCAPSEIRYAFFDLTCDDGQIDLPTFGVNRGGVRWPVSPTLGDVYDGTFTNATNPWLWTESDDISAATGSLIKPCVRVPCPTFDERRLECYGICLTAGNLADDAYPEATAHQISLLRSAHYHAMNARFIATMVGLSGAIITGAAGTFGAASGSTASDLPGYVEWAAEDIRTRFGMCEDGVVEVVLPTWARAVIRQDLARKNALDLFAVSDEMIANFFDVRSVRVQWVRDWQTRGTDQPGGSTPTLQYPTNLDFMIYPAGTFGLGNGMTLDLGVVRDSALNSKNDHTALWTEECHLIAKFGPVSRQYRHVVCAAGNSGAQPGFACL